MFARAVKEEEIFQLVGECPIPQNAGRVPV